jgi:hypothetical protein
MTTPYHWTPRIAAAGRWAVHQLRDHLLFTRRAVASQAESLRGPSRRARHGLECGISYTQAGREPGYRPDWRGRLW